MHDLAALESHVRTAPDFALLVGKAIDSDTGRGGEQVPRAPSERFLLMIDRLTNDPLWADEYEEFVHSVSFARANEIIRFSPALESVRRLVEVAANDSEFQ